MSVEINPNKKRFTKSEAAYLLARPWLTDEKTRKSLQRMMEPKEDSEESEDSEENENPPKE